MSTSILPSILVPFIGLIFPILAMGSFFLYSQEVSKAR